MRLRSSLFAATAVALAVPATASAASPHVVKPGESLWSIAAANNLTTRTVASFNGLGDDADVVLGSTINVPTVAEGAASLAGTQTVAAPGSPNGTATTIQTANGAPSAQGAYTIRLGDTLSHLAASAGVSISAMATMNGLDPKALLIAGTVIKLPSGAAVPAGATVTPAPTTTVVPKASPEPTNERLNASTVQQIAAANGVPASLAAAIAYQESGFNNNMVSAANARGVMQIMPGTWDFVQANLAGVPLSPVSATDNVKAGVLYLKRLLSETGGDERSAIAGYYQGLGSVRQRGFFDDTKQYVDNVQSLRSRFGGSPRVAVPGARQPRDLVSAGMTGALLSGVPSTLVTLARRESLLDGALAAGSILLAHEQRPAALLAAAVPVHAALSFGWAAVLAAVLPPRAEPAWGALGGLAIAALDLELVGRRFPAIRALPQGRQWADHVAFGVAVGVALRAARVRGASSPSSRFAFGERRQ